MGDIYDYDSLGNNTLTTLYSATTLKSDIMQVAHHGISGMRSPEKKALGLYYDYSNTAYGMIAPEYAFWPVCDMHVVWKEGETVHDLQLDEMTMNRYIWDEMDQSKVYVAADDVVVMTINDGAIGVTTYADATAYLNS